MSKITRTFENTLERIITEEILANASQMIDHLSKAAHGEGAAVEFDDLCPCLSAPDYSEPPEGYSVRQATSGTWFMFAPDAEHQDEGEAHDTEREAIIAAWEDTGDEPDDIEALQHWLVSDWLAEKLEEVGALVAKDILGFSVWGRTECGQGLDQDSDLQSVARLIDSK